MQEVIGLWGKDIKYLNKKRYFGHFFQVSNLFSHFYDDISNKNTNFAYNRNIKNVRFFILECRKTSDSDKVMII